MKSSIRHRLLVVALLGVVSCVVSFVALGRVVSLTRHQRVERAREAVTRELQTLRKGSATARGPLATPTPLVGLQGGYATELPGAEVSGLPDGAMRELVRRVINAASETHGEAVREETIGETTVIVGASPAEGGSFAWVSYAMMPPAFITFWRLIGASLAGATLLLVATALEAVASVKREASSLNAAIAALATDLTAEIRRPRLHELGDLADGVAGLARELAGAQVEQGRLSAELARQDRLAALGRVAAGVAHEVRNPLASIKLRVDLGRARPGTPPELARDLASVSDEITRLDRLVADLLVVAGRRNGPRTTTALGPLVERRAALLRPWAGDRRVLIEVSGDAKIAIDADAVARAVDNLVRNAVEASPPDRAVKVLVNDSAEAATIRVLDHGAGVDASRSSELFEPFFTTKPEGTGLGLALSRAIATAHEGALTYGRRDRMTCFELLFPHSAVGGRAPEPRAPVEGEAGAE